MKQVSLKLYKYSSLFICLLALVFSCEKSTGLNNIVSHNKIKFSSVVLSGYPSYNKSNLEINLLTSFANESILNSSFILDSLLYKNYTVNLPSSRIVYINNDLGNPINYIAIERDKKIVGFVIGISKVINNNKKIIAGYRDYSNYNYSTFTGRIIDWDLNENYMVGDLIVEQKKMKSWIVAPHIENKSRTIIGLSIKSNRASFCDSNKDGDIGFGECYKCMKDACNTNGECMAICDLLYFGAACSGTIAAACLYIAATN